jgi:hypothetical protein
MVLQNHPPSTWWLPIPADPPPKKKKKTAYHLRGGPEYHPREKNHFFIFLPFFACFTMCSSEAVSGQTKMDFKNPREVFSQHGLKNKNLSQFLQWSYEQGESKPSFEALFFAFPLFCYSPDLAGAVTASWGRIW